MLKKFGFGVVVILILLTAVRSAVFAVRAIGDSWPRVLLGAGFLVLQLMILYAIVSAWPRDGSPKHPTASDAPTNEG